MDLIERVAVEGRRVVVRPHRSLRRYLLADFFAEYDEDVDLGHLPPSILLLPFLWNVAAIVWATDETYTIDALEPSVEQSMNDVRTVMRDMYPSLPWLGNIEARSRVTSPPPAPSGFDRALLFSGGLDSTYSALNHAGPGLLLISIWGAYIPPSASRRWAQMEADNRQFATANAGGLAVVRSNFQAVNKPRLRTLTKEIKNWWSDVQFAMAFTGLTAPVLYQHGIPLLHIASSYSESYQGGHGSLRRLDNLISLGHAAVHHDGAEVTRQEKLQQIVRSPGSPMQLRVCHANRRYPGRNCGNCPKCLRTIVGLVVAGADPAVHGFPQVTPETISDLPMRFAAGDIPFSQTELLMWHDIQGQIPAATQQDPFLAWLQGMDFERYLRTQKPRVLRRSRINRLAARMPRLYAFGRRVRRRLP